MVQPRISEAAARETVELVNQCLREGYRPANIFGGGARSAQEEASLRAVANGLVRSRSTFTSRVAAAKLHYGIEPDESLWAPVRYQQPVPVARLDPAPPPVPEAIEPQGDGERVLIIPDTHNDPRHPHRLDVWKWLARFGADRKVPRVVMLGDRDTWDSVSSHDKNDTVRGRYKPPIRDDMDACRKAYQVWHEAKGDWKPKQDECEGNHENRLARYENLNPEAHQTFTRERTSIAMGYGWRVIPFGEIRYIEGVAITHHPINGMGRPFTGKTGSTRVANETTCSIIHGHTHKKCFWPAAKIGPQGGVEIFEAGCALPWGEVESYALTSTQDWWWGAHIAWLNSGRIIDVESVSMLTLRRRYSDDGADVR